MSGGSSLPVPDVADDPPRRWTIGAKDDEPLVILSGDRPTLLATMRKNPFDLPDRFLPQVHARIVGGMMDVI